jgi:hypothetical protein
VPRHTNPSEARRGGRVSLVVLTLTFSPQVFFDAPLNGPILLGCAIVIFSIFGYRDDCDLELQMRELSAAHARAPAEDL